MRLLVTQSGQSAAPSNCHLSRYDPPK